MRIHFIGICGVAMSALAIAFKKNGSDVTGSDAGFFPPVFLNLEKHGINFYAGWHPEKMIENGIPDVVVVGNVASSSNPEWLYIQKNNIKYKSYPEIIADYFIKPNSIVCAGTYGKTSTSALLSWILTESGYNPAYMFGGLTVDDFDSAKISDDAWSVLEGDEYKSARWDNQPKFTHYSPTHLILTAVEWDHADIYPTELSYKNAFSKLISLVSASGLIVACADNSGALESLNKRDTITYGKSIGADYRYDGVNISSSGLSFNIKHKSSIFNIHSSLLGDHMAENICGAFALAHQIGIEPDKIIRAIAKFNGLKRRLEKRFDGDVVVFDDIAHSPAKARSVLETLRKIYNGKIIAIFEPNTGNRKPQTAGSYNHSFGLADQVIIPELTKIKTDPADPPLSGKDIAEIISKTQPNTSYFPDDNELMRYIHETAKSGDVVVFMGSRGFRGMIEKIISLLQ